MRKLIVGNAVLYHADARDVLPQLADRSVDFVFTDPPYGHNNNDGDLIARWEKALGRKAREHDLPNEQRPIANDGAEANDLFRWFVGEVPRLIHPGACCCCCCCGGGGPDPQFARWSLWLDDVLDFKQMVVWDKGPMGMGWHYRRSYETVLVAQKPGAACRWYDETKKVENIIRPGGLIQRHQPAKNQHPTAKDSALAAHFIRLHSQRGDLVLDPFMGGGSTLWAALQTGRRFVGVECDERWFDACVVLAEECARQDKFLKKGAYAT